MNRKLNRTLVLIAGLTLAAPAWSAGYLKIGDIKGEATAPAAPAAALQAPQQVQPAGLLLPAVQKARDAAAKGGGSKGKVEYQWKVEEGTK